MRCVHAAARREKEKKWKKRKRKTRRRQLVYVYVYVYVNVNVYVDIYANAMQCQRCINASPRRRVCQQQKGTKRETTVRNSVTGKTGLIVVFTRPVTDLP